jgi:dihydropteroate synthase
MGIVNVTPDSFSDGGDLQSVDDVLEYSRLLLREGADIIDIGGESTRPGSVEVSAQEEIQRILPVVSQLKNCVISVDTRHIETAKKALDAGSSIINNVEPLKGENDPVALLAAKTGAGLVVMHWSREGKNSYDDVARSLETQIRYALNAGCHREQLLIDPGIGFSKTREEDLVLLAATRRLSSIAPLLIGVSRKRTLNYILKEMGLEGSEEPKDRLGASVAAATWCAMNGASVLRVHDVKETCQSIAISRMLCNFQ